MQGPKVSTDLSCEQCDFCERAVFFSRDEFGEYSGTETVCSHPDDRGRIGTSYWKTPDWCPLLSNSSAEEIEQLRKENTELWSELNRIKENLGSITELCDDHFDSFLKWGN